MLLLLTALVRLWSGRSVLAVERADEARSLFARVGDTFGQVQAQTVYGRASVASGRVDAGLRALEDALALSRRAQHTNGESLAATVELATALHIGDPARAADVVSQLALDDAEADPISATERESALGLYHLQAGDPATGRAMLADLVAREGSEAGPGAMTSLALAFVMEGNVAAALEWADRAHESSRSTYLDLALSYVVAGLANAIQSDASEVIAAFSAARQEVDSTRDVVAQAIVRLAESHAMAAVGATSARSVQREAERRLADLGIRAEGWSTIFGSVERWRSTSRAPVS
jgi:hypothetical protein